MEDQYVEVDMTLGSCWEYKEKWVFQIRVWEEKNLMIYSILEKIQAFDIIFVEDECLDRD